MNQIILVGRPGREPETKQTPSGAKVVTISLGVDRRGKNNTKETDWIDCTAWGQTADFVEKYVRKGEKAYFVMVDKVELLSSKSDSKPDAESGDVPFEV